MINITDIFAGWLTLTIGDKSFKVSYLTDVKEELDRIFNLRNVLNNDEDITAEILRFDGEGPILYLTVRKEYSDIVIIWEEHRDKPYLRYFEYDYNEFCNELESVWKREEEKYNKIFKL